MCKKKKFKVTFPKIPQQPLVTFLNKKVYEI